MRRMFTRKRSLDNTSRAIKRVNSKEELVEEDADLHPRRLQTALSEISSRTRVFSSARIRDIAQALQDSSKRERALSAMTDAHCSEPLKCYLAIVDMEDATDGADKTEAKQDIYNRFVREGPEALCLPDKVREKLIDSLTDAALLDDGIEEVKKHALNDLRFNAVLLRALGSQSE